jgi:hypothetical protein
MASPVNVAGATMVTQEEHLGVSQGTQTQSQMEATGKIKTSSICILFCEQRGGRVVVHTALLSCTTASLSSGWFWKLRLAKILFEV